MTGQSRGKRHSKNRRPKPTTPSRMRGDGIYSVLAPAHTPAVGAALVEAQQRVRIEAARKTALAMAKVAKAGKH